MKDRQRPAPMDSNEDDIVDALLEAARRDPVQFRYGYFDEFSAPGIWSGGFYWFRSTEDRREFFLNVTLEFNDVDFEEEFAASVREWINAVDTDDLAFEEFAARINPHLQRQLKWWNTFDDLLSGDSPFALQQRIAFREQDNQQATPYPVPSEDVVAFKDYLEDLVED